MKKIIALVVALFLVGTILVPMARINAENVTAVKIYIDKSTAYVNGKATTLDQPYYEQQDDGTYSFCN